MKYTHKNIFLVILFFISIVFNSCEEEFLERTPTDEVATGSVAETTKNLFLIINGIHRSLYVRYQGSQGRGGIGALMIQNDAIGEDYVMTGRANAWFINAYQWNDHTNASDGDDLFPYRTYYRIIRNANTVIDNAEEASGLQSEKEAVLGQALIYRAWSHFQLVQLYGKRYDKGASNTQLGVPIRLSVDQEPVGRNTVEEVYAQVNEDLDRAILLLTEYQRYDKSDLDRSVALGLKARVALVQGNYEIAAEYAELAQEGYTLMPFFDYFSNFSNYNSDEWMWGSHMLADQSLFFANYGAYISRNFSSTNIRQNPKAINSTLYDAMPSTDVRKILFDPTGNHFNLPPGANLLNTHERHPYTSQKFIAEDTGDSRMDVPYMRVSEMYLIEAEAKARLGDPDAAQALFEMAVIRNPSYTLSTNTGQDLIDEILLQRRWELWGEGFRFYDLKRLNMPLNRNGANHIASLAVVFDVPAGDNRWQWKIPQDARDANPLLEQNP